MNFTVDFSDGELARLRAAKLYETVLYRDPPVTIPGFREPLLQRLTLIHLIKRRPNRRTFATPIDANIFERTNIVPQVEKLIRDNQGTARSGLSGSIGRYDRSLGHY